MFAFVQLTRRHRCVVHGSNSVLVVVMVNEMYSIVGDTGIKFISVPRPPRLPSPLSSYCMTLDLLLLLFPLKTFNGRLKCIQAVILVIIHSYVINCRSRGLPLLILNDSLFLESSEFPSESRTIILQTRNHSPWCTISSRLNLYRRHSTRSGSGLCFAPGAPKPI